MTYNPNTPLPKTSFADWQIQFIQNFTQMGTAFAKNHVPLDAVSNAGDHTILQMYERDTSQQVNLSELAAYSKDVPDQTDQLFLRYEGNGVEFQYTNYQIYSLLPTDLQTSYFTFLPGGLIIYFGLFNDFNAGGSSTSLFLNPPIAKNIISVSLTPNVPQTTGGGQSFAVTADIVGIIRSLAVVTFTPTYYLVVADS